MGDWGGETTPITHIFGFSSLLHNTKRRQQNAAGAETLQSAL
jgi:hypothetical protein